MLIGVVGKPSCGKSTFFKAATLAEVEIANYPFTTIKPNHGIGFVRIECVCKEFETQCHPRVGYCVKGQRFVSMDMIDVAGLVPGAHKGEGMGSQFLNDLNQADALIHVIDASGSINEKGEPVAVGSYDPVNDVRFLEEELDYWYLDILKKGWEKFARTVQQTHSEVHKAIGKQLSGLGVDEVMCEQAIKELGLSGNPTEWKEDELFRLAQVLRKRTKPMMIAANKIDVAGAKENVERLKKEFPDYLIVECSAESELALKEAAKHELIAYVPGDGSFSFLQEEKLNEKQKGALSFIQTSVLDLYGSSGVQQVLNAVVFDLLEYIAIFPGGVNNLADSDGNVLPDCFLMKPKSSALDFAFKLHTDFGKNFIKAINVKKKLPVGREYLLEHRDVIEIHSKT
ncbi:translation-associated GTPase [Candidatus Woesearchaeota archaeon]|nr:translation-associated GTPase [Candidatus Woesearchaeota archaeon]